VSEALAALPVAPLLAGPVRRGRVLGAFPRAVYVAVGEDVVALVARDGLRLPIALVLPQPAPLPAVRGGSPALVGDGAVVVGALRATPGTWWDPRPAVGPLDPSALAQATTALTDHPSEVADHLLPLAEALAVAVRGAAGRAGAAGAGPRSPGAAERAADRLLGRGPGLTPAGDDLVAGVLATLRLFGGPELAVDPRGRTTTLSAALLRCAARGAVLAEAATLLRALGGDGQAAPAALALTRVGHSSGRDLAAGILLAAGAVLGAAEAAA